MAAGARWLPRSEVRLFENGRELPVTEVLMEPIGVAQWCLGETDAACIKVSGSLGFGAIQIGISREGEEEKLGSAGWRREVGAASRTHAVAVTGFALNVLELYGIGESPTDSARSRALRLVGAAVEAAGELGATLVYVPNFRQSEITGGQVLERAADFFRSACRIAGDSGIAIASENTLGVEGNLRLIEMVANPAFSVLVDSYNPQLWGHSAADLILKLGESLSNQAHVKDGLGSVMGSAALGTGEGKVAEALEALVRIGYQGTIVLENDYRGENRRSVGSDLRFVREHLSSFRRECAH